MKVYGDFWSSSGRGQEPRPTTRPSVEAWAESGDPRRTEVADGGVRGEEIYGQADGGVGDPRRTEAGGRRSQETRAQQRFNSRLTVTGVLARHF